MQVFNLLAQQEFDPERHVEKILGTAGEGDVTVACWEPGQISPYHCHPSATEIYFCFQGGGTMNTPRGNVEVTPGSFRGSCDGYYEQMHFVAGSGSITDSEGAVTAIHPGVVMLCPDGWSGVWTVEETVRKTYAVVKTG